MDYRIEAVKRMQKYIWENLEEPISLNELSQVSMYSPWHSYRIFTELTGYTPSKYIRSLKLSASALKLRDGKVKVADVAFELGFGSVDGYQRAFFKEFGCNPGEYAKSPKPIYLFTPYGVLSQENEEEKEMKEVKNVFIQVIQKPKRNVIVKRATKADNYWEYGEQVGCDVWGLLMSMDPEPVSLWLPKKMVKPNTSVYVQGVEKALDAKLTIPEGFDVIQMPEATYLKFQGEPFAEEEYEQAIQQIWDSMAKFNPRTIGYDWDDENPRIQLEPRGERGYIELRAIKPIQA